MGTQDQEKNTSETSIKKSYLWLIVVLSSISTIIITYVLISIFQNKVEAEKAI